MITSSSPASGVEGIILSTESQLNSSDNSSCSLKCDEMARYGEKSFSSMEFPSRDSTENSCWTFSSLEFAVVDEGDEKTADSIEDKAVLPRIDQCSENELRDMLVERLSLDFTDKSSAFPSFRRDEVKEGRVLGRGEWGTVSEIRRFFLNQTNPDSDCEDARSHLTTDCFREGGDCRYVMKRLKNERELEAISDPSFKLAQGGFDLAVEAAILSNLNDHANITKMHAISREQVFGPDSFLVLDRLYHTLQQRLSLWRQQKKEEQLSFLAGSVDSVQRQFKKVLHRRKSFQGKPDPSTQKSLPSFFGKQIKAARDLSSALAYIHEKRIIHRDLKPQNIGFDLDGNAKVFDFAMARVMPRKKDSADADCRYNFTRMCGSLRYMAPEVGLGQPYNESCDVYSFAILFWEILTLESPYGRKVFSSPSQFQKYVWDKGGRPSQSRPRSSSSLSGVTLKRSSVPWWSPTIDRLLDACWSGSLQH